MVGISESPPAVFPADCNVLRLPIEGTIVSARSDIPISEWLLLNDGKGTMLTSNYSIASDALYYLDAALNDPQIKGLLLSINSDGGIAQSSQEIADAVDTFAKPSVAAIHAGALSGGYFIASAADRVFALEMSEVGSIAATNSFVSNAEKNKKEGITYLQLSSGPFKDMFSPDKPLSEAERALIMRDIKAMGDTFARKVSEYRGIPYEKVSALADGSTMLASMALENGLIDELGSEKDATRYLADTIDEPVSLCWL